MRLNINPFNRNNPMTWKDAAAVAAIAATATYVLAFLVNVTLGEILIDPAAFAFDSAKIWLQAFFGNFITLAGIEALMKSREGDVHE